MRGHRHFDCGNPRDHAIDEVEVGDVVDWNGRMRKVRRVTRCPRCDQLRFLTFAKLRCSWTNRPTTTYFRAEALVHFRGIFARDVSLRSTPAEFLVQDEADDPSIPGRLRITDTEMAGLIA